jgi:hypothetical protein
LKEEKLAEDGIKVEKDIAFGFCEACRNTSLQAFFLVHNGASHHLFHFQHNYTNLPGSSINKALHWQR